MFQLDFFPRKELNSLADFQGLVNASPAIAELKGLIGQEEFFQSPKTNQLIRNEHSSLVDRILGFRPQYVEQMLVAEALDFDPEGNHETLGPALHDGIQTWVGLDLSTLQTPYSECLRILKLLRLKPYQQVVDLGAAYGRMGVVLGGLFIKSSFTGFEYVKARVDEGNRVYTCLDLQNCRLVQQDLFAKEFRIPEADLYFIYDFGQVEHIDHTLSELRAISEQRPIQVVTRGRFTKEIIEEKHPWLGVSYQGKLDDVRIYRAYH
ncbi:MAG TPA: hypothetical protein VNJ01_09370 [Bacteriovoracaceae bacterium]|nr:hypothetical protein [Bacteriovoracaceae bacterium]